VNLLPPPGLFIVLRSYEDEEFPLVPLSRFPPPTHPLIRLGVPPALGILFLAQFFSSPFFSRKCLDHVQDKGLPFFLDRWFYEKLPICLKDPPV